MIDIKLLRERSEIVAESQKKRGMDEKAVEGFLELDKKWRETKQETDALRSERNKVSEMINEAKKQGKKADELIKKAREIPERLEKNELKLKELEEKRKEIWENLPNIVDSEVPVGKADKNKI
ncbi:MAG: hypothetical protein AABX65_03485 [Nanoarchaeota archaeon]